MKLTALEIKKQTFEKSFRGYDPSEVESFLQMVASEWEHLTNRNKELSEEVEELRKKLLHYEKVEAALHETLQSARDSAEMKVEDAEKESKHIIEKANLEAEAIIQKANEEKRTVRLSIQKLLDRRLEIISRLRNFLETAQESVDRYADEEADLYAPPPDSMGSSGASSSAGSSDLSKSASSSNTQGSSSSTDPGSEAKKGPGETGKKSRGTDNMDDILDEID